MLRVLVALCLAALTIAATPAHAKWQPTSVLVRSGSGDAVRLDDQDRVRSLSELMHASEDEVRAPSGDQWRRVTVTWLVGEGMVWRVDRLALDGQGRALVREKVPTASRHGQRRRATWHRIEEGATLTAVLTDLDVLPRARPVAGASPAAESRSETGRSTASSADAWRWALPALLGGLLLGVLGSGALRRTPQAVAQRLASS